MTGCVCVIWDSCRKHGGWGGAVYFPVAVEKGGVSLHVIGPVGWFQCEWRHNFVPDLLKVAVMSQLSLSLCLSYLCPPSSSLIQLLCFSFCLGSFFPVFPIHFFSFGCNYFLPSSPFDEGSYTGIQSNRRVRQRWEREQRGRIIYPCQKPSF